jgi:methylmalonyl-CoA/ethylmalonyl-CoA epimerase
MIEGIDHIGIFVPDIEAAVKEFCGTYELPVPPITDVPERRKKVAWIEFGSCPLELVEDYDSLSDLHARALAEGGFIHHFALRATAMEEDLVRLESKGCERRELGPSIGLRGKRIQFIEDKALALLIELTEP